MPTDYVRARDRRKYANNASLYRGIAKRSQQSENGRANSAARQRRMRLKWPQKMLARSRLRMAILRGDIVKQPCEVCGKKAEAHHDDYSKPLEVRWFCHQHHRELEGRCLPTT